MQIAKPNTAEILKKLNKLRQEGVILTNSDEITRLEKSIETIKAGKNGQPASMESIADYWLTLASLRCVTGDFKAVLDIGEKWIKLTNSPELIYYHVVSLVVVGYFSKARELFDRINDYDLLYLSSNLNVALTMSSCQSYSQTGDVMDSLTERFPNDAKAINEANIILEEQHITEKQVLAMMDLAGEMMRSKNVFLVQDPELNTYSNDRSMTISLPVNLPASQVAELEWEYLGKVISMFPDVRFSSFSIGFSCAP